MHIFQTNKVFLFITRHKFWILLLLIMLVGFVLRVYNFPNRWGLGNDDARDISIAMEALRRHELPLIGSFSSAGPFVFGPLFYWFLMFWYLIFPHVIFAPWVGLLLTSIATIGILIYLGYKIGGVELALIIGMLAATSPQLVIRSLALGQHSLIAVTSASLLLCFVLLWQKKKSIFAFGMGLSVGIALSLHYQAINLLIFFVTVFFIPGERWQRRFIYLLIMIIGFIIPSLPLLIWDSQQNFANIRNILDYLLIGQYRLYVPNSWKLFIFSYIPNYWQFVFGGYHSTALVSLLGFPLIFAILLWKRRLPGSITVLGVIFAILLFINRYYKGERSEGYLIYFSPFILLFGAYVIYTFYKVGLVSFGKVKYKNYFNFLQMLFGICFFVIVVFGNMQALLTQLVWTSPVKDMRAFVTRLSNKYPGKKFSMYDYKLKSYEISQPLSVLLKEKNLQSTSGIPIGVTCAKCAMTNPVIESFSIFSIHDLRGEKNLQKRDPWIAVNQSDMYDSLIGWSKKHALRSSFSLSNYILERLGLTHKL